MSTPVGTTYTSPAGKSDVRRKTSRTVCEIAITAAKFRRVYFCRENGFRRSGEATRRDNTTGNLNRRPNRAPSAAPRES